MDRKELTTPTLLDLSAVFCTFQSFYPFGIPGACFGIEGCTPQWIIPYNVFIYFIEISLSWVGQLPLDILP